MFWKFCFATISMALCTASSDRAQGQDATVDTALVIAVDVSQSVDENRYKIQMQGIAAAFEDLSVVAAITGGSTGQILVTLVTWTDTAETAIPWTLTRNKDDASTVAAAIRALPTRTGEFTCMARMMRSIQSSVLEKIPLVAKRVVVDVSGDGIDNCDDTPATGIERDKIVSGGGVVNRLPIIVAGENDEIVGSGAYRKPGYDINNLSPDKDTTTLDTWYRKHVIGGMGALLMDAKGYEDFGRAFRQKFVTEVSCLDAVCR